MTKFYWTLWALLAAITVALEATGNLSWLGITVIGFVSCLFIFMGMICVTPTIVGPHAVEFQHGDTEPALETKPVRRRARDIFMPAAVSVHNRHV